MTEAPAGIVVLIEFTNGDTTTGHAHLTGRHDEQGLAIYELPIRHSWNALIRHMSVDVLPARSTLIVTLVE